MSLFSEFKAFVMRGNVVDLAVGIIIGAAFSGIVSSLVSDILTPPIGALAGGIDFKDLSVDLPGKMKNPLHQEKPKEEFDQLPEEVKYVPVKIAYGKFLQRVFDFLIVAVCLFFIVKAMNKLQKKEEAKPTELTTSEKLLMEIRDSLKK